MFSHSYRAALAAALLFSASSSAFSQEAVKPAADVSKMAIYRGTAQAKIAQSTLQAKKLGISGTLPGGAEPAEEFANPYRSYPPSCLESPMALGMYANDPNKITTTMNLPGDPISTDPSEESFAETDTVTVFRVPCSGGTSATLLEIDRPAGVATYPYPIFPGVYVTLSDGSIYVLRILDDPNTFKATTYAFSPVQVSDVFVLENYYNDTTFLNYNVAFQLSVDNLFQGALADTATFDLPAYTPSQYAAASEPLKINGYLTGTWYDSAHSGEGIQTEVGDVGTAGKQRFVSVSWYTYDATGRPYWLIGSGLINIGDNTAAVTLAYTSGGGFAGDFGSTTTNALWGTINVSFPDCNTMKFTYASSAGLPSDIPSGFCSNATSPACSKTWQRLTQVNGLTCQ
jgi:hypothetical protein